VSPLKVYRVSVPMSMSVTVRAENEEAAKEIARNSVPDGDDNSYDEWTQENTGTPLDPVLYRDDDMAEGTTVDDVSDDVSDEVTP